MSGWVGCRTDGWGCGIAEVGGTGALTVVSAARSVAAVVAVVVVAASASDVFLASVFTVSIVSAFPVPCAVLPSSAHAVSVAGSDTPDVADASSVTPPAASSPSPTVTHISASAPILVAASQA